MPCYSYSTLESDHIRLFRLFRRLPFTPPRGELIHVSIASKIQYEAVSYRWDNIHKSVIEVNHRKMEVQASIYKLLQYKQSWWEDKLLWIDSICINQASAESGEKEVQIPLMSEIYSNATRVLAWLGPMDNSVAASRRVYSLLIHHSHGGSIESWGETFGFDTDPGWEAFSDLLCNEWYVVERPSSELRIRSNEH